MKTPRVLPLINRYLPILIVLSVVLGIWASTLSITSYYRARKKAKELTAP